MSNLETGNVIDDRVECKKRTRPIIVKVIDDVTNVVRANDGYVMKYDEMGIRGSVDDFRKFILDKDAGSGLYSRGLRLQNLGSCWDDCDDIPGRELDYVPHPSAGTDTTPIQEKSIGVIDDIYIEDNALYVEISLNTDGQFYSQIMDRIYRNKFICSVAFYGNAVERREEHGDPIQFDRYLESITIGSDSIRILSLCYLVRGAGEPGFNVRDLDLNNICNDMLVAEYKEVMY